MPDFGYEYVIWDKIDNTIHRGPMPEHECEYWMSNSRKVFGNRPDKNAAIAKVWEIRRRAVGDWESYVDEPGGTVVG